MPIDQPLPLGPYGAPTSPLSPISHRPPRRPPPGLLLALALIALLVILVAALVASRSRHDAVPATAMANLVTPVVVTNGALLAAPNPVAAGTGKGTTIISWITPDGAVGQVWVSTDGQPEVLFAQGASGAQYAPFILAGHTYVFRLYAGTGHAGEAAQTVTVTHQG